MTTADPSGIACTSTFDTAGATAAASTYAIADGVSVVAVVVTIVVGTAIGLLPAFPDDFETLLPDEEAVHMRDRGVSLFGFGVAHEACNCSGEGTNRCIVSAGLKHTCMQLAQGYCGYSDIGMPMFMQLTFCRLT